jgi:RhtB (resistance to homoserine/threonine) family protein
MDTVSSAASFALLAGVLTVIPGLDTALVLRSSIAHGRRIGFATAAGVNTGVLVWGAGAAVGVSALLTASHVAYTGLRTAGAIYLAWMGFDLIRSAWRNKGVDLTSGDDNSSMSIRRAWLRGLLTNILNPKVGVFYMAVLPQFVPPDSQQIFVGLLLAVIHNVEGFCWFAVLIVLSHAARSWLRKRRVQRTIDGATGSILIVFGVKMALSEH